jgi:hypothetical protein
MNIIARLFLFYEQVQLQQHREIGGIFDYEGDFLGPKMIAELIVRFKAFKVASMLFPPNGVDNILTLPSGKYRTGFRLDHKITDLFEKKHFIVVMQREAYIESGNYILIKVSEDGTNVYMYRVMDINSQPVLITNLELECLETHAMVVKKMYDIALGEMESIVAGVSLSAKTTS